MDQQTARLTSAFTGAFKQTFPVLAIFTQMLDMLKSSRPITSVASDGNIQLAFDAARESSPKFLANIFHQLTVLQANGLKILVVLNEFQEVHHIAEPEGLLRDYLQNLQKILVILVGSKKHLLAKIFITPSAPFFNWGTHIEFRTILY